MTIFSAEHLTAGYGDKTVVKDVSFTLEAGCLAGILGANGSGKTTLLKSVCGILPHAGRCTLHGEPLEGLSARRLARQCGYIPQRSGITIDLPVLDVVLMGFNPRLGLLQQPTAAMRAAARDALQQVGLGGREEDSYLSLSEGQKQLCILARTLVQDCSLLLLDEPESALDFRYRYQMLALLRGWAAQGQRTALVTLHDPALALNCCDRLLLLHEGQLLADLCPRTDPPERMEPLLSRLYGPVELARCRGRLVMLPRQEGPQ